MSNSLQDTETVQPAQVMGILDDKEAVSQSCVNTTVVKAEKLGNIFAKLGFTPRGENWKDRTGNQPKDESQKKTSGAPKTQDPKSESSKKQDKDSKDPKSDDEPKLK